MQLIKHVISSLSISSLAKKHKLVYDLFHIKMIRSFTFKDTKTFKINYRQFVELINDTILSKSLYHALLCFLFKLYCKIECSKLFIYDKKG